MEKAMEFLLAELGLDVPLWAALRCNALVEECMRRLAQVHCL